MSGPGGSLLPRDFDGVPDDRTLKAVRTLDRGGVLAPGFSSVHAGHVKLTRAQKRSEAEHVAEVVDPWLRDCPPLPKARVDWVRWY